MPFRLLLAIALVNMSSALHAQSEVSVRHQVYGGYSYFSNSFNAAPRSLQPLNGWDAYFAFPPWHSLRFKLETYAYRGSNLGAPQHALFIMGGGQYSWRFRKESVFVEGLLGEAGLNSNWGPNQVIRDTLALLEHQFKTAQIGVDLDLAEQLPPIHGNPGKLQQVFLNLLLNAKDAMPGGGNLRVSTLVNGHVEALITDSGSGIAPEHLKRIYDPFFTTKTTPRPGDRRGTGLGLSVSYGIIQEHAGKIHVESAIGAGTTFHLEFPLLRNPVNA